MALERGHVLELARELAWRIRLRRIKRYDTCNFRHEDGDHSNEDRYGGDPYVPIGLRVELSSCGSETNPNIVVAQMRSPVT
jgi:hypothetical protein